MTDPTAFVRPGRLRSATVLRVHEDSCEIASSGRPSRARYATLFPTPRVERVSPGHLVAVAAAPDDTPVVVWRWYDAVVLGAEAELIRLWEPAHDEVLARPRSGCSHPPVGTRAYLSAGLPGADWWVAGPATGGTAEVELDEVERLYTDNDLWPTVV